MMIKRPALPETASNTRSTRPRRSPPGVLMSLLIGCVLIGLAFASIAAVRDINPPPLTRQADDGIHDPNGAAINILQDPKESMKDFPKDRRGEVNWVQTLRQGFINPRVSKTGEPWEGEWLIEMDMDIIMKRTANMPYVRFPHLAHTQWLACSNCHPAIFIPQKDANAISMTRILNGRYCGVCHDKVAFSLYTCERCHNVLHEGSGPQWWTKWW